jgi:hypothetical protein
MSKVEKITEEDLLTKLKECNFPGTEMAKFRDNANMRGGFRSDLRTFFSASNNETMSELIRVLIYFSCKESEKNEFGKPKRKNRRQVLDDNESIVNEFIDKTKIDTISINSFELMFSLVDAQLSNLISDKNFLAQIIMLKSTT